MLFVFTCVPPEIFRVFVGQLGLEKPAILFYLNIPLGDRDCQQQAIFSARFALQDAWQPAYLRGRYLSAGACLD
jgi:hypothetical protein